MTIDLGSLIGKKGSPKPPHQLRQEPAYASDPRWAAIRDNLSNMTDEEIYQVMKASGLIDDYPQELGK